MCIRDRYEVSQAAYLAYEASQPVTGTASKGAALFRKKAAAEAKTVSYTHLDVYKRQWQGRALCSSDKGSR